MQNLILTISRNQQVLVPEFSCLHLVYWDWIGDMDLIQFQEGLNQVALNSILLLANNLDKDGKTEYIIIFAPS